MEFTRLGRVICDLLWRVILGSFGKMRKFPSLTVIPLALYPAQSRPVLAGGFVDGSSIESIECGGGSVSADLCGSFTTTGVGARGHRYTVIAKVDE